MQKRISNAREPLLNSAGGFCSSLSTAAPVLSQSDVSQYLSVGSNNPSEGLTEPVVNIIQKDNESVPLVETLKHYPSTSGVLQIPIDQCYYEVVIDNTDPGLEWMAMMNDKNACVSKVDWSKSPLNVKVGMRLVKVDNLIVQDQPFDKIMSWYYSAIKATSEPTTLVFADGAKNLKVSADVASALVWKKTMEAENYNSDLRNRAVLFIDGLYFQCFMLIVICTDFSIIYFDHSDYNSFPVLWIQVVVWLILIIYALDVWVRIYAYSTCLYFHKCYCVVDFLVVLAFLVIAFLRHTGVAQDVKNWPNIQLARLIRIVRPTMRLITECTTKFPQAVRYKVRMNKMSYRDEKFNLDLCYITSRIISMSLPSKGLEKTFRNPIEDVVNFFDAHHPSHYMVYDLCLERSYQKHLFHNRVQHFKFQDHSVPTIAMMLRFCNSVQNWMVRDPRNVIAVHCKGGKGRTGTMICAWLLYRYRESNPADVIKYFADMRTNQALGSRTQGIETPSQVRYVNYFYKYLHDHKGNTDIFKSPFGLQIHNIEIGPFYNADYGPLSVDVFERPENIWRANKSENNIWCPAGDVNNWRTVTLGEGLPEEQSDIDGPSVSIKILDAKKATLFRGNLRVNIYNKIGSERRILMSFWINTFLLKLRRNGKVLKLSKSELDKVHKDAEHKMLPPKFQVRLVFRHTNRASFQLSTGNLYP